MCLPRTRRSGGLQHADLEEQLEVRGRELMRQLFQDRLNAAAAAEERRYDVTGEDGVVRTRADTSSKHTLTEWAGCRLVRCVCRYII
jgi:hypothetical protein